MIDATSSALSGLRAAEARVGVASNNIANQQSVGRVDATDPSEQAFQAQEVVQSTQSTGGTQAQLISRSPGSLLAFDPNSPLANNEGLVDTPNVDLGQEFTNLIQAENSYGASLEVLQVQDEIAEETLDILS